MTDTPANENGESSRWWQVVFELPEGLADDAAALCVDAGAAGVEVQIPPIVHTGGPKPVPPRDGHARLICSFPDADAGDEYEAAMREAVSILGQEPVDLVTTLREDSNWAHAWKEHFKPLRLGEKVWIVPTWEDFSAPDDAVVVLLDPGMAFGTGQHATTALCMRTLESHLSASGPTELLDVGCGSGILAIAAAKMGAPRVVAIDNDADAVKAATENVELNDVTAAVSVADTPVGDIEGTFPLVVANILAHILIELAPGNISRVAAGGTLILSGILAPQRNEVHDAYSARAKSMGRTLELTAEATEGEWVALTYSVG